jgi:hypothetical protein
MEEHQNSIALKEYVDTMVKHEAALRNQMILEQAKALELANNAVEFRLRSINELRDVLDERVGVTERFCANLQGRIWMFSFLITGVNLVVVVISFLMKK